MTEELVEDSELALTLVQALGTNLLKDKTAMPFSFGDMKLLSVLEEVLPKYMHRADVQSVLDDLRTKLVADYDLPNLKSLHELTKNCRKCPNLVHSAALPTWNLTDPDVLFILDTPKQNQESYKILTNLLKDIGFSSRRVALTYLNRCAPKEYRAYSPEEIENCLAYLFNEIQILRPKLIVLLGSIPLLSFFGTGTKLKDCRGQIIWLGPWAFLPTYSPGYLRQAGESQVAETRADISRAYHFTYGSAEEEDNDPF